MEQNFTLNDLVRFVYHETSETENAQILDAVNSDNELYTQSEELESAKRVLPKVTFAPTRNAVDNILRYSQMTALEAQF